VDAAAKERGVEKGEMVKCILLRDKDAHYVMACVPGDLGVDPRAVSRHVPESWRRLYFAKEEEILGVTGCPQGAVAPLGLPSAVPVIFDSAIMERGKVNISSGEPTAGIELNPKDLAGVCGASMAEISKPKA
jgi:Ala-tRNA(Pro) deacylase